MNVQRAASLLLVVAVGLAGCSESEMSLTEYVDRVGAIFDRGIERYEALVTTEEGLVLIVGQGPHLGFDDQGAELTDFTPQDLGVALEEVAAIQDEAVAAAATIEPPGELAEIHALYFRELPIAALAARAATAPDWQDLSDSPEMAAYRTALAADIEVCAEFQTQLDATAERGAFNDLPWMPSELTEIVDYALGCDSLPANPEDVYRPPSA